MKEDRFRTFLKKMACLINFWPAGLVIAAVAIALPQTVPVLQKIPERLVLTEANAAEEKPALPDPEEEDKEEEIEDSGNTYKDGVYTGSSRGYGGTITVEVTVKDKKITSVSVVSAPGETGSFLSKAKGVIDRVLQAQTWEVDVVSGATYSSRGILGAIRNALTGETVENEAPPKKDGPVAPIKKVPFDDNVKWKDGVYIGSAQGYGGTIKVQVTIKEAKISAIKVLEHKKESSSYFNKAKKVIKRIIAANTPNVDTVSGATYSSNGIINAVKNALKKAAGDSSSDDDDQNPTDDNKNPGSGQDEDNTEDPDLENGLKDGKYTTDVPCTDNRIFDYSIRLVMVVKDGRIKSITATRIKDESDNPEMNETYLGYAVSGHKVDGKTYQGVIKQILNLQTTKDVDVVSGATYSSKAIIRGVKKLLKQAAKSGKDTSDEEDDTDDETDDSGNDNSDSGNQDDQNNESGNEDDDDNDEQDPGTLKDGSYVTEASCTDYPDDPTFDYTLKTTTVIEGGKIVSITVERTKDNSEDPDTNDNYVKYAVNGRTKKGVEYKGIVAQIIEAQSTSDIDVVSGATYSSKAIINCVRAALAQAAESSADEGGSGEESDTGKTDDAASGEGSDTGKTDDAASGESSETGKTDDAGSGEGSDTGKTDDTVSGESSETGKTDDAGSEEGSDTGKTDDTGSGESSETGKTDDTESGESSETGKTDDTGSGEGSEIGKTDDTGSDEEEQEEKNTNKYLDGSYSASAHCEDDSDDPIFDYTVKVTVVIKDGKITDVSVERTDDNSEEPEDNDLYFGYAENGRNRKGTYYPGIPAQVKEKQSASGLDAVSGATYTSKAMIKAAGNALSDAENPDAEGN